MMESKPTSIQKTANRELAIEWDDGHQQLIPFRTLRDGCQCATCLDKKSKPVEPTNGLLPILSAAETQPIMLLKMLPVGNYAYNLQFSDGHSTGIYTLEHLRSLQ